MPLTQINYQFVKLQFRNLHHCYNVPVSWEINRRGQKTTQFQNPPSEIFKSDMKNRVKVWLYQTTLNLLTGHRQVIEGH